MRTVIVYEYTRRVAEELASVAREHGGVDLVAAEEAGIDVVLGADLVLIGGQTQARGMSCRSTGPSRTADAAPRSGSRVGEERPPGIDDAGPSLREWFQRVDRVHGILAAAYDTRLVGPDILTGRASLGISRRLRHHGFVEVAAPRSFLVDSGNNLLDGEVDRARDWATSVLGSLPAPAMG